MASAMINQGAHISSSFDYLAKLVGMIRRMLERQTPTEAIKTIRQEPSTQKVTRYPRF